MDAFFDFLKNISDEAEVILELSQFGALHYLYRKKVSREKLKDSLSALSDMTKSIEKLDHDIEIIRGDIKKIYTLLIQGAQQN